MNKLLVLFFLVAGIAGCPKPSPTPIPPTPPYNPPNPYSSDSAVPDPARQYTCADVCKHGFDLNCPWAQPTPNGATCLDVCNNIQTSGVITWNLACKSTQPSCAAIDACK